MLPAKKTRDWARSLVAREADGGEATPRPQPKTVRVYDRLRRQLGSLMGVDGFQAVASRALALAKAQTSRLEAVRVAANGGLLGLDELGFQNDSEDDGEAGIVLIAHLLGLFLDFLGEATTLRLIEDLHRQVDLEPDLARAEAGQAPPAPALAAAFDDLLVEINRLRSVGEHIEALAGRYPGMEAGLESVAGNIHSMATVLDIFSLIKSKSGSLLLDAPLPPMNGLVH